MGVCYHGSATPTAIDASTPIIAAGTFDQPWPLSQINTYTPTEAMAP